MFQEITIIGNLGQDPELRYTPQGDPVTSFSLATNRKWTNASGQPGEETTWFRVSVWGKQAEACNQYLAKGRQVFVKGRLTPDKGTGGPRLWTDQHGQARASFEIRAMTVQFLGGGNTQTVQPQQSTNSQVPEDEIPF
jgi:single-strand DNA-binding protein